MTNDQKIIKNIVGLLRLAQELDNVNKACEVMGYSWDSFYRFMKLYNKKGKQAYKKSIARSHC